MSARVNSIYLVTEGAGSALIYTAATGWEDIPYLLPGERFGFEVELANLATVPLMLVAEMRVLGRRWQKQTDYSILPGDTDFMYFPPKEEPLLEMPGRNVRAIIEVFLSGAGRQDRLDFTVPWAEAKEVGLPFKLT